MKKALVLIFGLVLVGLFLPLNSIADTANHLVINEVYYNPSGTESDEEWLELYNPTSSDIDLKDYYLKDLSDKKYTFESKVIPVKGFLVLARDKTGFLNLHGFNADVVDLSLTLNNGAEVLFLHDDKDILLDTVAWGSVEAKYFQHAGVKEGESLERQPKAEDTNDPAKDFIAQVDPTPGLGLFKAPEIDKIIVQGNGMEIRWSWDETDKTNFKKLEVYLTTTSNFAVPDKIFLSLPGDKLTVSDLDFATTYEIRLAIVKEHGSREIKAWSDIQSATTEYDLSDEIIISELYPAPPVGGLEFIELYNSGNKPVNLKAWYLSDLTKDLQINYDLIINPNQYLAIYNTGITLNNTGDIIRLRYPDHSVAHKVEYSSAPTSQSYAKRAGFFFWTPYITPNLANRFPENLILKPIKIKKALKQKDSTQVIVKGRVSVEPLIFGKQEIYIQDSGAGIQIYNYHGNWPKLKVGDKIKVQGEISSVRGEKRIKIASKSDIKRIQGGGLQAKAIGWQELSQQKGRLIKLSGEISSSAGSTFYLTNGQIEIKIYIKSAAKITKPTTRKGYQAEIVGILTKTDSGFKLLPRYSSDLKINAISQIADYGSVIESAEGIVAGVDQEQPPIVLQTIKPMDQRTMKLANASQSPATPQQQAGTNAFAGAGIILTSFLAYLYRLPLFELIAKLKG